MLGVVWCVQKTVGKSKKSDKGLGMHFLGERNDQPFSRVALTDWTNFFFFKNRGICVPSSSNHSVISFWPCTQGETIEMVHGWFVPTSTAETSVLKWKIHTLHAKTSQEATLSPLADKSTKHDIQSAQIGHFHCTNVHVFVSIFRSHTIALHH